MNSGQSQAEMGTHASGASLRPVKNFSLRTTTTFSNASLTGIPPCGEGPNPQNWQELNNRLVRRRPSLSESRFSEEDFRSFPAERLKR